MRMSIPDDLTSLVPDDYTARPSAGLVPNPLALIDAARLIAAGFGWSASETFAGIFGAIWRGEIKRVFTWEAPRIRFRSEPDQEIGDILASPPPGAWVDGNAVASDDTGSSGGRRRDAADDARRKNKIETVLAAAKQLWPDNQQRPSTTAMALELVRQKKAQGYAGDTLRKILDGKYRPSKRLSIDLDR
jgi:peptidoglycan/xylan/chitin deacetylase (PgdA/CDA1 family)